MAKISFSQKLIFQNLHLAKITFSQKRIFQNFHLANSTFLQKLFSKICIWPKLHLLGLPCKSKSLKVLKFYLQVLKSPGKYFEGFPVLNQDKIVQNFFVCLFIMSGCNCAKAITVMSCIVKVLSKTLQIIIVFLHCSMCKLLNITGKSGSWTVVYCNALLFYCL